jgi:putative tryptophan/tyrosine transport system substrate-binding protein
VKRRDFIALVGTVAGAWPIAAFAQQQEVAVVGFLSGRSSAEAAATADAFRGGLREAGYLDAKNVSIEYRWAEGKYERLPLLAAELVSRQVAVIFATGGAELAAKSATSTIPIVFTTGGDPVELGLVSSINRPEGNMTGVTFLASGLGEKQLDLLRQFAPNASRIALLVNPDYRPTTAEIRDVQTGASKLGLDVHVLNASTDLEIDTAFVALGRQRPDALVIGGDPVLLGKRKQIISLAASHTLPTIYPQREYVDAGGLMSYGTSLLDGYRQTGIYAGKILAGIKPAALPVMQPTQFDLVINLKTAKALGLAMPNTLLVTANEVIE